MLRRDVRLLVFLTAFVLVIILLFQLHIQSSDYQMGIGDGFEDLSQGRNLKSFRENQIEGYRTLQNSYKFDPLPISVINTVDRFLFFIGYARSGHSIVASMLDAHPNIVIAHEYALFTQWQREPQLHSNRTWLFNAIYNNSRYNTYSGLRTEQAQKKGYTLNIPGWWQGRYDGTISVIGDKSGGMTAQVFRMNHRRFVALYSELQGAVQVPIHVIHVVRNPYDNIATMLLYNTHQKANANETHKYEDYEGLEGQIVAYFNQVGSVVDMIEMVDLNVIEVHNSDLISNPKGTLRRVCLLLHIDCSPEYLHMCAEKTFTSESRSRKLVEWTPELINLVAEHISKYNHLKRYTFES